MIPAMLITFREVIEAALIVATILGILYRLNLSSSVKTVWIGTATAGCLSMLLVVLGSFSGLKIREFFAGDIKEIFEGSLLLVSAVFITWAVFWLHHYFSRYKLALLQKVKITIYNEKQKGLFILVFTAVFREGFEIALFLSTIYLSSTPLAVFAGVGSGALVALIISVSLFTATLKIPIFRAFQATTVLLILFAAGQMGRGVHEFIEAGVLPQYLTINFSFLPAKDHLVGDMLNVIFGWSRTMDFFQLTVYAGYVACMRWFLYSRRIKIHTSSLKGV